MEPEALPAFVGAKLAVKEACAPAAIVCPTASPVVLNPAPEVLTWLIVTAPVPEFLRVIVCWPLLPTTTSLKLKLPGLAERVPFAARALPLKGNVCGVPGALSAKTTPPVVPVVDAGVNWTLKATFCPAVRVFGSASPLTTNPFPETVAAVNTKLALPLFVNVTF